MNTALYRFGLLALVAPAFSSTTASQAPTKSRVDYEVFEITARPKRAKAKHASTAEVPRPWTRLPDDGTSVKVAGVELAYEIKGTRLRVQHGKRWITAKHDKPIELGDENAPAIVVFRQRAETWFVSAGKVASFEFDEQRFTGVDLDGDGRYFTPNVDGILFADTGRVVPTPEILVGPYGQYRWSERDGALELVDASAKSWPSHYYTAVWRLNQIRSRVGIAPVRLGEELCAGCDAHADYINKNFAWLQAQAERGNVAEGHTERKDRDGYSDIGKQAAASSVIAFKKSAVADAVEEFLATLYHRQSLLDLRIDRVGIGLRKGTCLVDVLRGRMPQGDTKAWAAAGVELGGGRLIVWPPAGMTNVPVHFNRWGELPRPWPEKDNSGSKRGYPLTMLFVSPATGMPMKVSKFEIELFQHKRKIKGHKIWPEGPVRAYGDAKEYGFVPKSPLKAGKTYTARISFEHGGKALAYEWKFETAD